MPQGRMTEEQAYKLAGEQKAANNARRRGTAAGGFKGIATPGQAIQVQLNGKRAYINGTNVTDDSGPSKPPRNFLNDIGDAAARTRQIYANRDAGLPSNGRPSTSTPEKKPIVQMRQGMSPSSQGFNRSNETPVGDASKQLKGYAYDLIRRGKSFDEARKLMQGTEQFRGLSQGAKDYVLNDFDMWRASQSSQRAKGAIENVRRGGQPSMSQAPNKPNLIKQYQDEAANYGF